MNSNCIPVLRNSRSVLDPYRLAACFMLFSFDPEDGTEAFLPKRRFTNGPITALYPRRWQQPERNELVMRRVQASLSSKDGLNFNYLKLCMNGCIWFVSVCSSFRVAKFYDPYFLLDKKRGKQTNR
jgi:hypothetical protein